MANLIIKPTSGGSLILQDEGGDAALTVDTSGRVIGVGGLKSQQVFTTAGSATWTKPAGITTIKVYVTGVGGGANCKGSGVSASGGGGGTSIKIIDVSSISSVAVTIGAGGAGTTNTTRGATGGTSSFGSHCTGLGGQGGFRHSTPYDGGLGGLGTGGDLNLRGDSGAQGAVNGTHAGGGSFWGGSGKGTDSATAGDDGDHGGGGGGLYTATVTSGGDGICVVEEYS